MRRWRRAFVTTRLTAVSGAGRRSRTHRAWGEGAARPKGTGGSAPFPICGREGVLHVRDERVSAFAPVESGRPIERPPRGTAGPELLTSRRIGSARCDGSDPRFGPIRRQVAGRSVGVGSPLVACRGRRNARTFAQHVARQADDDGYTLGSCVRISAVRVHCPVTYYGDRCSYQYGCSATIQVFIKGHTIFRGPRRPPRCETYYAPTRERVLGLGGRGARRRQLDGVPHGPRAPGRAASPASDCRSDVMAAPCPGFGAAMSDYRQTTGGSGHGGTSPSPAAIVSGRHAACASLQAFTAAV